MEKAIEEFANLGAWRLTDVLENRTIKGPLPAVDYPYRFSDITVDEECFEYKYMMMNYYLFAEKRYKTLIQQLIDKDILEIPIEYLDLCPSYIRDNTWRYNLETYYQNHGKV